jgi:hypothetical protein
MKIRWHNLFVAPRASVVRTSEDGSIVRVEGLVCDTICERRTLSALRALPGVTDVCHVWGTDEFVVMGDAEITDTTADSAVQRVVTFRLLRHLLALLPNVAKPHDGRL